jgi:hypothetical protein
MKKVLVLCLFVALSLPGFAQNSQKVSKEESSKMTHDQRVVKETDRKSKHGKKKMSTRKKVRIAKKEARKAKRMKQPKRKD